MRRAPGHEGNGCLPLIDRRAFVKLLGISAAGVAAGACAPGEQRQAPGPASLRAVTAEVAERSEPGLNVFQGGGEFLSGRQRFPFGLGVGGANEPISSGSPKLWVARAGTVTGPVEATFEQYREPGAGDPSGFFLSHVTIPEGKGVVDLLVEADGRYGFAAIVPRDEATVPAPGQRAIPARTPTDGNLAGVEQLCTRTPRCTMHDASLHTLLGGRKPVVLSIASPKLCTSRTCGPVLEEVLAVRDEHGAAAEFVHVEPYAGNTATRLSPAAVRWKIESEPWTFVIGRDGTVAARFEGPVVAREIERALLGVI